MKFNFLDLTLTNVLSPNKSHAHSRLSNMRRLNSCILAPCELIYKLILFALFISLSIAYPMLDTDVSNEPVLYKRSKRELINDDVQRYLMQYGYLPMSDMETGNLRTEKQLREAIKVMQRFGHVNQTGILDEATKELMFKKRCGLPDVPPHLYNSYNSIKIRRKRFVKQGSRWNTFKLTWGIQTYPKSMRDRTGNPEHLSKWEIDREIRLATEVWERASKLTFKEMKDKPHKADIVIQFREGYHGDGYPFDGPGMTLAHAFYPGENIGGDMHFDAEEFWVQHKDSEDVYEKVSLFITAAHELGHALGLYHSDVEGSLMSPYLIKFKSSFKLPPDDVRGIQELYGVPEDWEASPDQEEIPTEKSPTLPPRRTPPSRPMDPTAIPDTCDTEYDAISVIRQEIYIFRGKYFWRLDRNGRPRRGYPAEIIRFWSRLPKNFTRIDAVYERPHDNSIVFFIGQRYYICKGNDDLVETGPLTKFGLPEDLPNIDAAMVWSHNGRTFFFAQTMYWRFDENVKHVELDYPRDMIMWKGVPYYIDSAFKYNGTTYFFKGKAFWQFDDLRMMVRPKSPLLAAPFWMSCPDTDQAQSVLKSPVVQQVAASASASGSRISHGSFILMLTVLISISFSTCNVLNSHCKYSVQYY